MDRNRITGSGVTSVLELRLTLVKKLRGTEYAQGVQPVSEYDPKAPLDAGSETKDPERVVRMLREMLGGFNVELKQLAQQLATERAAGQPATSSAGRSTGCVASYSP